MKSRKNICLIVILAVVILELLPYGAVLNFGNPDGDPFRKTFSYFSLTPFGYANLAPFMTAVLSVVILLHIIAAILCKTKNLWKGIRVESSIAGIVSFLPVVYGFEFYSGIGFAITILLVALFFLSKQNEEERQ
ncbi:MAG: hypothetical protein IJN25_09895 [Clostridia bacterium]|nr:hypothetical protein [Clostridia bacterium]